MTVLISNLEKSGCIVRTRNGEDKRSYKISLTEKGKSVMEEIFPKHLEAIGNNFSVLTNEEKMEVIKILKRIKWGEKMNFFDALKREGFSQYSITGTSKISNDEI